MVKDRARKISKIPTTAYLPEAALTMLYPSFTIENHYPYSLSPVQIGAFYNVLHFSKASADNLVAPRMEMP